MKKIILGLFVAGLFSIVTSASHAQIKINLKNRKKYEREHQAGAMPQKHLRKHNFWNINDKKPANESGIYEYNKALKRENRKTAKIAANHVKHTKKYTARIKRKDQVGI